MDTYKKALADMAQEAPEAYENTGPKWAVDIRIRNIPAATHANIMAEADRRGVSQQKLLAEVLEREFGEPPLVWGYIRMDRPGDIDYGQDCPVCGEPGHCWWIQVTSNGAMYRMCDVCATSE